MITKTRDILGYFYRFYLHVRLLVPFVSPAVYYWVETFSYRLDAFKHLFSIFHVHDAQPRKRRVRRTFAFIWMYVVANDSRNKSRCSSTREWNRSGSLLASLPILKKISRRLLAIHLIYLWTSLYNYTLCTNAYNDIGTEAKREKDRGKLLSCVSREKTRTLDDRMARPDCCQSGVVRTLFRSDSPFFPPSHPRDTFSPPFFLITFTPCRKRVISVVYAEKTQTFLYICIYFFFLRFRSRWSWKRSENPLEPFSLFLHESFPPIIHNHNSYDLPALFHRDQNLHATRKVFFL